MYSFQHKVPETEYGLPAKTITYAIESEDITLDEMLIAFEDFLKGCGYVFDGHVTIEDPDYSREDNCSDSSCHVDDDRVCQGDPDSETVNQNPSSQMEFNFEQLKAHREENGNGI